MSQSFFILLKGTIFYIYVWGFVGIDAIFFIVAYLGLCVGFVTRIRDVLAGQCLHCFLKCPASEQAGVYKKLGRDTAGTA